MRNKRKTPLMATLARLMEEQSLTNSDLAAKIWGRYVNAEGKNVARGRDRISQWLNGRNRPSKKSLDELAKALNVKVSDLTPEAEMKAAHQVAPDWVFSKPTGGEPGLIFIELAMFLPDEIALAIHGLLVRDAAARSATRCG